MIRRKFFCECYSMYECYKKYMDWQVRNMATYKVEICGVNTSKLPLLTETEKEELIKKVKAGKEVENPRYYKKAEEEIQKVIPSRQHRRLALKALKKNPDDILEFLKDSTLKI